MDTNAQGRSARLGAQLQQGAGAISDELMAMVQEVRDMIKEVSGLLDRLDGAAHGGG